MKQPMVCLEMLKNTVGLLTTMVNHCVEAYGRKGDKGAVN